MFDERGYYNFIPLNEEVSIAEMDHLRESFEIDYDYKSTLLLE